MFTCHIEDSTQYTTIYKNGEPVGTIMRKRVYEKGPTWKVYRNDGSLAFTANFVVNVERNLCRTFAQCETATATH